MIRNTPDFVATVARQFRSLENIKYLSSVIGKDVTLEASKFHVRDHVLSSDFWECVRVVNMAFIDMIKSNKRSNDFELTSDSFKFQSFENDSWQMNGFVNDSLHPPGRENLNSAVLHEFNNNEYNKTRFMRYEEIPFWQKGGHEGYEKNIDDTLGLGSRELENSKRGWNFQSLVNKYK